MAVAWKSLLLLGLLMASLNVNAQTDNSADAGDSGADAATGDDMSGGQQLNEAGSSANTNTSQGGCYQQTQPSTMQVFMALLEPVNTPNDVEAAQDAPRGMVTVYVDSRSGQAYVAGSVNNIQNLTAVTLNVGNSTQEGPVILPLLPSASRVEQSPRAQAGSQSQNASGNSQSQGGGANSISPFSPALPWVTAMEFSERVALSDLLPLTSNATLNTSANTQQGANTNYGSQPAAQRSAAGGNGSVPLNASGNLVGAQPFTYVNVTDLNRKLSNPGVVTVMTIYMADGTTISTFNITNSTSGQAGNQGVVSPVPLMQAGLAYISVHTSQSGRGPELRGQLMPYGKVVGNSAAIANSFPDKMAPMGTYTTTVCNNATSAASSSSNVTSNATTTPVGVAQEAGTRAQNQTNLLANSTWTNQAAQVLPAVRTAMSNLTSSARNLNGSYAIFSAAVQAAETAFNASGRAGAANGRRLMQASASTSSASSSTSTSANASNGSAGSNAGGSAGREAGSSVGSSNVAGGSAGREAGSSVGSSNGQPGITVFAPSDKAIQSFLQQQGLTQQQLLSNQQALLQLISYHIVPTQALSAQTLASRSSSNGALQTLLPNNTLEVMNAGFSVAGANSSVVLLRDGMGTANVRDPNMAVGKVVVHGIDKVLVPQSTVNQTQSQTESGNASMNKGVAGGASAGAGGANAGVSGNVSPNGADADVQTSDNDGSRRLMRRLFMLAHNAHLV